MRRRDETVVIRAALTIKAAGHMAIGLPPTCWVCRCQRCEGGSSSRRHAPRCGSWKQATDMMNGFVTELATVMSTRKACALLGMPRATGASAPSRGSAAEERNDAEERELRRAWGKLEIRNALALDEGVEVPQPDEEVDELIARLLIEVPDSENRRDEGSV
jgi:hypothetical protein